MKTIIYLAIILFTYTANPFSQWLPDLRLTNNPSDSRMCDNNAKSISSSNENVHVVWFDNRDGNLEIYYKRSTNNGANWGSDVRLTTHNSVSRYPAITSANNNVFVTWVDQRDGNDRIYFKRSTDNGASWSVDFSLSDNVSLAFIPAICVSGNTILIIWGSISGGTYTLRCKRSPDAGYSWATETIITSSVYCCYPSVSCYGETAVLCWADNRDGNEEIYFSKSSNLGINWNAETRLTNNVSQSTRPSICIDGRYVYVAWVDDRDGNKEIYFRSSYNYGGNWFGEVKTSNAAGESSFPNIAAYEDAVHIVWEDFRNGADNSEVYYKMTTNRGGNWSTETRLTNNSSISGNPHVAVSGSNLHVVWHDFRNGALPEIYYKRNPTGNPIGIQQISTEIPTDFIMSQNYPNPFNPETIIRIQIPESEYVRLAVFDASGKEVALLVNEHLSTGTYEINFEASELASGVYFYRLTSGSFTDVKKMMLVK